MDIQGRITEVEFEPGNYFRVRGMVNSKFNESRMFGMKSGDGFTMNWYWFESSMPPEVFEAFNKIIGVIDAELQWMGILPKKWPGLLDNTDQDAEVFKFDIKKYKLSNTVWLSAKEQKHIVSVTASSKWFTNDKDLERDIPIRLKEEDLIPLFQALENNL